MKIHLVWSLLRRLLPVITLATLGLILGQRAAAQPALSAVNLGDLRPGAVDSFPEDLTNVEGVLYFTADDGTHGRELWKSNPRTGETKMLIDLNPGAASSAPGGLVNFQGRLYFAATTPSSGRQLWVYDPENEATTHVVDATSGTGATAPESLTPVGPCLFFTADDGIRGRELWFHRRRKAGSVVDIVKDITPGPTDPHGGHRPLNLTVVGSTLYFSTSDGLTGLELWKVEAGSVPAGTKPVATLVRDIVPGPGTALPADLVSFKGRLFFTVHDNAVAPGRRLWQSDGTAAGTKLVDPNVIVSNPEVGSPRTLVPIDDKLFFPGSASVGDGAELLVTDGTVTSRLSDIYPGFRTSNPSQLTKVFGVLFFAASDGFFEAPPPVGEGATGKELWRSDGTAAGTRMVKDVFPGSNAPGFRDRFANSSSPTELAEAAGILFFAALDADSTADGRADRNLWMSDGGTDAGTLRVLGLPNQCNPEKIVLVNTTVFFTATDAARGRELWKVELPDADGDGLLDKWETFGIDYNLDGVPDLRLAADGARPDHKDVFVEVDFMKAADHTHDPELLPGGAPVLGVTAMHRVINAFAAAPQKNVKNPDGQPGVKLHVFVDEEIPEVPAIRFISRGPGALDDFQDLKQRFFGFSIYGAPGARDPVRLGAHRVVFRYAVFGHSFTEDPRASGIASGSDLFVSLAAHGDGPSPAGGDFEDKIRQQLLPNFPATTFGQEWIDLVAGTFMHELGHTLGLLHGGGRGIPPALADNRLLNHKPNYLSVMNYSFQANKPGFALRLPGIPDGITNGITGRTLQRTERPLDYSSAALLELEENVLLEGLGIAGPAGRRTLYGVADTMGSGIPAIGPADAAMDWDADRKLSAFATGDINFFGVPSAPNPATPGQTLLGHDDWSNLVYNFRDSFFFKGGELDEIPAPEPTADELFGILPSITASADLALRKTSTTATVSAGANFSYTLVVTNQGPDAALNFVVTDHLPATTSFISCSTTTGGVCGGSGNDRTISFASLAKGASATITLVVKVNSSVAPGTLISNTATLTPTGFDPHSSNNSSTTTTRVVAPNRPPVISRVMVCTPTLWPPNHKLRTVTVNYTATDDSGVAPTCTLSVRSNEPLSGTGTGDLSPDWQIVDAHHVKLRAERSPKGTGRVYTITVTCRDRAGLSAQKTVTVQVPKHPKK